MIQQFDEHNGIWLSAVVQEDTVIARFSNQLSLPGYQLYEAWLMDENTQMLSAALLQKMCFSSVSELSCLYCPRKSPEPYHAVSREFDLVREIGIGLGWSDASFHHSEIVTPLGPVASIVFGSFRAMEQMYQAGLRKKL